MNPYLILVIFIQEWVLQEIIKEKVWWFKKQVMLIHEKVIMERVIQEVELIYYIKVIDFTPGKLSFSHHIRMWKITCCVQYCLNETRHSTIHGIM